MYQVGKMKGRNREKEKRQNPLSYDREIKYISY